MNEKTITNEKIIDGVRITEYSDGSQRFEPIEQDDHNVKVDDEPIGFLAKLKKWYDGLKIKPTITTRDLNDPFDVDKNTNPFHDKDNEDNVVVIGLKGTF